MKQKKGQMTIPNIMGLVIALFLFFALAPTLINLGNNFIAGDPANNISGLNASNPMTPAITVLVQLFPTLLLIFIIITGVYYAIPKQNQY